MKLTLVSEINYILNKKNLELEKNNVKVFINLSFLSKVVLDNKFLYIYDISFIKLRIAQKLLFNVIIDLLSCVTVVMEIVGFNHQVKLEKNLLIFDLGFSSLVKIEKPSSIFVEFIDTKNKFFSLSSFSRREVVLYSKKIRSIKPPNLYTGHGIKYVRESIIKKQIKK